MSAHDRLRVALLNPCFMPEVRRGSERMIRDVADGLVAAGHRPRLITSHPGPPSRRDEAGLVVTRHRRPAERLLRWRGYPDYLGHVPLSYASLRAGRDDLAHAFYPTDALAAARWSDVTGKPSVFSYMGLPTREVLASRRLGLRALLRAVNGSDAVVSLSRAAADGLARWLGVEATVIHPGVDLDVFHEGGEPEGPPTVFCPAASDDRRKRIPLLVEAFARVRRERPDAALVLMRPREPATAAALEAEPGVELFDPVDEPARLAPLYRRAWVTALASYSEAFGIVLIESLASGRPVVGRREGGVPEIVTDPAVGRLFEGEDPATLAGVLLEALEAAADPAARAACRGRAAEFSTARCGEAHIALYRELLTARHPRR